MSTLFYSTLLLAPLLLFLVWHLSATLTPPPTTLLTNKRIILLIAHPDDESMFFSPTLQSLTHPSLNNHLKILCLSTGNSEGIGATRVKELERAALMLGLRKREDVYVMDDERRFKDGMGEKWDEREIARVLASAFAPQLNTPSPPPSTTTATSTDRDKDQDRDRDRDRKKHRSKKSTSTSASHTPTSASPTPTPTPPSAFEGPRATIDVLLTFDGTGISSHPNHIALYHGARLFLANLMKGHNGYACPVSLYTLTSVNVLRKYSFVLDVIPTYVAGIVEGLMGASRKGSTAAKGGIAKGDQVLFVSDVVRYWTARRAMVQGHQSQMVWFRWGWIGVGRYMVVNDLRRERVVAI